MAEKYFAVFSHERGRWCVFEKLTDSIRVHVKNCIDRESAEELADKLNSGEALE